MVDLPANAQNPNKVNHTLSKIKRKILKHVWIVRGVLISLLLTILFLIFLGVKSVFINFGGSYYFSLIKGFAFPNAENLTTNNDRINLLILGKGGLGHEAPDLTDTIMFASISEKQPGITLVSVPRDIWISPIRAKINSAYYWGNKKQPGGGTVLAKTLVEEIIGQPINYALVIDFSGFKNIIDALGGVDVNVANSFVDEKYPIAGKEDDTCGGKDPDFKCRYETVKFEKGLQHMDGETALKFSRSRYAKGDEGTDIARSARQEKVIAAIKDKALSREILTSPKRFIALKKSIKDAIETDLTDQQLAALARWVYEGKDNVKSNVLSEDFLINPPLSAKYDYQYVFVSKTNNWDKVHQWVDNSLQ